MYVTLPAFRCGATSGQTLVFVCVSLVKSLVSTQDVSALQVRPLFFKQPFYFPLIRCLFQVRIFIRQIMSIHQHSQQENIESDRAS